VRAFRILHIEDDSDISEIVAISLSLDPGLEVRACSSGMEGLAVAAKDAPDLILLDVMMPCMDGPTTLAHLRENPRTAAIPVVFITARAQSREIEQFKSLGAAGVIAKPFDPMTLAALVRCHIRPAEATLASSRGAFLLRVQRNADTLFRCWSALAEDRMLPSTLVEIRDVAHGLAGAGGIFGFPRISEAAADLEEAALAELDGANASEKVERALERLLTSIEEIPGGVGRELRKQTV
jgi:CheY-like chemotaxis protein